jgi:F0F1-type ATP synthase membrane subunit b/b'
MAELLKTFDLTTQDATMILVWAGFFLVFWQILSTLCWTPLLKLVEAREAATVGASQRVEHLVREREELERTFDNEILKARIEGAKVKSAIVSGAKAEAQLAISRAEQAASLAKRNAAEEMASESRKVEQELEREISALSQNALAKMGLA